MGLQKGIVNDHLAPGIGASPHPSRELGVRTFVVEEHTPKPGLEIQLTR